MYAREFTIEGTVQGVYFRAATKKKAQQLGVNGWVANNGDGSVTVHAEGSRTALGDLEDWCQVGPSGAKVERFNVKQAPPENAMTFEIVY